MLNVNNPMKGKIIEFHILQSFPVTCLNRDDVGAPKSAVIGGVPRARVSSQCWKRAVRLAMHEIGCNIANRTLLIGRMAEDTCIASGGTEEQAKAIAKVVAEQFGKIKDDGRNEALGFISQNTVDAIITSFKDNSFDISKLDSKTVLGLMKRNVCTADDGLDIALFGRMVAANTDLNLEAACSFAHAISTHKVVSEIDFFTALDDLKEDAGSGHMGTLEFNSATYYRYVSLNLGQLWETLHGIGVDKAVGCFVKALYTAVPSARQSTQSGASFWDYARIYVRHGQRLQASFETPVKSVNGFLEPSKKAMCEYLDTKARLSGSLFGLEKQIDFGEANGPTIDEVIVQLSEAARS